MLEITVKTHSSPLGKSFFSLDPLYRNPMGFRKAVNGAVEALSQQKIDAILAIEGRGFILASVLAYLLGVPLIPARKAGKLPAAKLFMETIMGTMEVHKDALKKDQRVLVVDAVTNIEHSLEGAISLVKKARGEVMGVLCLQGPLQEKDGSPGSYPLQTLFSVVNKTPSLIQDTVLELIVEGKDEVLKIPLQERFMPRDHLLQSLKHIIRTIPHFPKEGIQFRDVTTIMQNPEMFRTCLHLLIERYEGRGIHAILGIESRGFIFGAPLAYSLGIPFIPVSKKGKTPGKTLSVQYEIEYGMDEIEIPFDALRPGEKALVIDDLIATGGTAQGACLLVSKLGALVEEVACIIELPDLKGREKLGGNLFTLIEFAGD